MFPKRHSGFKMSDVDLKKSGGRNAPVYFGKYGNHPITGLPMPRPGSKSKIVPTHAEEGVTHKYSGRVDQRGLPHGSKDKIADSMALDKAQGRPKFPREAYNKDGSWNLRHPAIKKYHEDRWKSGH